MSARPAPSRPASSGPAPPRPALPPALLQLADGRFPAGGHAHSGGVEAAVAAGLVRNGADLARFLGGRLHTAGAVTAGLASAAARLARWAGPGHPRWDEMDVEADARTPSAAVRATSRRTGRYLARTATRVWPHPVLEHLAGAPGAPGAPPPGPHQPVVLGVAAVAAGGGPDEAADPAVYSEVMTPATAAVRLLGLDPVAVAAVVAELDGAMSEVAETSASAGALDPGHWPATSAPVLELLAEAHASRRERGTLFAS